ncbi:MAG TPA: hypothetical protein VFA59_23920 [Vicinamibacterales bacterium]|nr:hypothetical protein [Vicinamibacterales bacterium]
MDEFLARGWEQLTGRLTGPMAFRFVMQPTMAAILAVRAGLADARSGQGAYLWEVITNPAERRRLLRSGARHIATVFAVACALDVAYQLFMFRWIYPGQTLIVAALLAIVPYIVIRGPIARLLRAWRLVRQ